MCTEDDLWLIGCYSQQKMREENDIAMGKLRAELEAQHQASINQLKGLWSSQKEAEIQQQVDSHITSAKATWKEELQKVWISNSLNSQYISLQT